MPHETNPPTALVTGGAGAIGGSVVNALRSRGWTVYVADRAGTGNSGPGYFSYDAANVESIADLFEKVGQLTSSLTALVNAAGIVIPQTFGSVNENSWNTTYEVNARATYFTTEYAVDLMSPHSHPRSIVNIASVAGRAIPSRFPAYASSKAAVISITQQAALALAPQQIRVNAICPGMIDTPFNEIIDFEMGVQQEGLAPGEYLRNASARIPLGRMGQPNDVAALAVFLLSPESGFITGQAINVDGGVHLG